MWEGNYFFVFFTKYANIALRNKEFDCIGSAKDSV